MNSQAFSVTHSLRRKLLLPLLLAGAALAVATVLGIYAKFQREINDRVRMRGELVANAVNYAAESVSRPGELQRIVTAIGAEEEVSLIVVAGGRPARVLATTRNAWFGKTLTELPVKDVAEDLEKAILTRQSHNHLHLGTAQFDFTSPLLLSRPELADRSLTDGAVMVHLDMRATQTAIRQLTLEFSTAFLATLVILAALGYGLIRRVVLRPITRIGKLVEHCQEGADESWAEAATDDEIGALARTLNDSLARTDAALRELKESEARFRSLVEQAVDAIFLHDANGRFLDVNRRACESLGYSKDKLLTMGVLDVERDFNLDTAKEAWSQAQPGQSGTMIGLQCRKDGTSLPVEVRWGCLDMHGQKVFLDLVRDITERKRAEEALRRSETQFRSVWERSEDGMRLTDGQGVVLLVNQAYCDMIGKPRSELEGQSMAEIYAADERQHVHQKYLERYARHAFEAHLERKMRLWNGKEIWLAVSTAILDPGEPAPKVLDVFRDITERQRAEAEVRAARDYLAKLINTIGDPVLVKDAQHRLVLVNDAECALVGRTREELLGKTDYDFFPKEQVEMFWKMDDRVLETGEDNLNEETLTDARTGTPREVITRKTRYVDPSGGRFVVAVIRDITDRKRAEEAMRENERLLRLIIDLVPHHIFAKDRDGRFLLINRAAAASCGRRPDEMIGRSEQELRPDEAHTEKFLRDDQEVIDQGASKFIPEEPITYPDNQVHFLQTTKIPFMPPGSKQRAVLGVAVDITERKRAETALRDAEALYHSLVTQLPQCILRKDREGRFTFVNQHFCRLLGKTPAEIQGRTDFDFFPRELAEKYRLDDLRVMQERRVCEQVEENAPLNGERIFVQVVKTPLVNADGEVMGMQAIFWDITERRRAEAERERLVAELQDALAQVKTLSGLVPICAGCKKIRDDKNYWHHVESYVAAHTNASFTHGMCPDCAKKYFPGLE